MGRPRKPLELHLRDGTYRPSLHGPVSAADEPAPPPDKPAGVSLYVSDKWEQVTPLLAGVLKPRDVPVYLELLRWLHNADKAAKALEGMEATAPKFAQMLTAYAIATDKILALSNRFGLTPSDRAKLRAELPAVAAKPKVATRPRTALDTEGPPSQSPEE